MHRYLLPLASLLAFGLTGAAPPVHAAESYDSCRGRIRQLPAVINKPGIYCLRGDLATALSGGDGISIQSGNVTLECNGFALDGIAAGSGSGATAVRIGAVANVTIRGCGIRGFLNGVVQDAGDGAAATILEDNHFDGVWRSAIVLAGDHHVVRRNRITDTGVGTATSGPTYGIRMVGGSGHMLDANQIVDVRPAAAGGGIANGIMLQNSANTTLRGNHVSNIYGTDPVSAYGILVRGVNRADIRDNRVLGGGSLPEPALGESRGSGIVCIDSVSVIVRENDIVHLAEPLTGCADYDNNLLVGDGNGPPSPG